MIPRHTKIVNMVNPGTLRKNLTLNLLTNSPLYPTSGGLRIDRQKTGN